MQLRNIEELIAKTGETIGVSEWKLLDQQRVNQFADVTEDHQFIHVDPDAAAKSPFGGTIVHGFLTLSMLTKMSEEGLPKISGLAMG